MCSAVQPSPQYLDVDLQWTHTEANLYVTDGWAIRPTFFLARRLEQTVAKPLPQCYIENQAWARFIDHHRHGPKPNNDQRAE